MARRQRQDALTEYYKKPNHCKYCSKIIEVLKKDKVSKIKTKKFCNSACSAAYNNRARTKVILLDIFRNCAICGNRYKVSTLKSRISYSRETRCQECLKKGFQINIFKLGLKTKGELRKKFCNWQSYRTAVRKHAELIFLLSKNKKGCFFCSYKKHYHVAHIKSVASFPDTTLLKNINKEKNLMGLCPTHHWEYDHNMLSKLNKEKLIKLRQ